MKQHVKAWASILTLVLLLFTSATGWGATSGERDLYIVLLSQPSLAEKLVDETPGMSWAQRRKILSQEASSAYRKELTARQEAFLRVAPSALRIAGGPTPPPLEVTHRTTLLLNSLLIRLTPDEARRMASMEGVRGVYPNGRVEMAMDAAPQFLGAPAAWERLGGSSSAGAGMRIAVIDSGIDIAHPMFQDPSLSPPLPELPAPTEYESFTNEKVIAARNYVLGRYDLNNENTAEDLVGHGSIVASIAAGAPVEAPLGPVSGIAPRAFLGSYRVFGDPSRNRFATDGAVIAALEDAINDGMDVVNLSLGGPARNPETDPQQIAIAEAVELGVVVVIASGNGGSGGAGSVMSPGTSPVAITVGSTSHPRVFGLPLEIASTDPSLTVPEELERFLQVPGLRTPRSQRFGPLPIVSIQSFDASGRACDPLPAGSLVGKFALVRRGICFFAVKAEHVLNQAGAAGMVVYNDVAGAPFAMDLGEATLTKPAVMIDLEHGERLRQLLLAAAQADVEVEASIGGEDDTSPFPGEPDLLAGFSGRGPTGGLGIKPDLVAPGQTLYTAAIGSSGPGGPAYTTPDLTAGTSFSTPMVSGGAALLKQLHPGWSPERIKSALVHYSSRTVRFNGRAALPSEAGNGRLDLAKSVAAEVLVRVLEDGSPQASSVSLAFGTLAEENGGERELVLELSNVGASAKDLTIGLENQAQVATISWAPSHLHLEPGAVGSVVVSARLSGNPGNFEGFLTVREALGGTDLAVPYFGVATVRGQGRTLRVSNSPEDFGSPAAALGVALPGDVIELAENAEYSTPLEISRNLSGVKLDGVTLRAAPGVQPVINALLIGDTLDQAVIRVLGLERVTIEGLTIRSRSLGIEYVDSSGIIRNNQILMEDGEGDLPDAIRLENSQVHLYANSIKGSNRDGVALEGSSTLAQANSIDSSRRHGFFADGAGAVALFDNWIHQSRADGVSCLQCPLLAKGNLVLGGEASQGDGVRAEGASSRLLLRDNSISGSGKSGLALAGGAQASLLGNDISLNRDSGLFLDSSTALIESARFFSNATAIEAVSSEVDLRNSLLADSESGSGLVIDGGTLTVDHSTVANNAGSGMEWVNLGGLEVTNSILYGNGAGDVDGLGGLFRFTLFEGPAREGAGNQSGDPGFIDAAGGDFTPGSGSTVIDGGDPQQPEGSSDLLFHRRVVDGDGDGEARTDIGAIEAGSPTAPSVILPILASSADNFVGLAMVNAYTPASLQQQQSIVPSTIRLQAYDLQGQAQGKQYQSDILPGRQLAVLLEQEDVLGPLRDGWVEILPTQRDLTAFSLVGSAALSFLDGAQLTSTPKRRLLFPEVRGNGENTWIYLVNPHRDAASQVRLFWTRSSGAVSEFPLELPPLGMLFATFHDLFGVGNGGYLVAEAELPVFGLELFGDATNRRAGLLAIDMDRGDTDLFGAQLASTAQIETTVHVINLGREQTRVVLTARGENGAVLVSSERILPVGGELRLDARDLFGFNLDVVGWIEVHSQEPVAGSVTFGDSQGRFLASLPLQPEGSREFFLSHVAQTDQIFTGLTLLNAGDETALVSLEVFNASGLLRGTAFLELKPGVKTARLLSELLNDSFTQAGGFIRVRSNQPILGFELFGARTLEYLSAVPPQISVR